MPYQIFLPFHPLRASNKCKNPPQVNKLFMFLTSDRLVGDASWGWGMPLLADAAGTIILHKKTF